MLNKNTRLIRNDCDNGAIFTLMSAKTEQQ
jgi:hypothetical protein